jgi:hypothetical protein
MSVINAPIRAKRVSDIIYAGCRGLAIMIGVAAFEGMISGSLFGLVEGFLSNHIDGMVGGAIGGTLCAMMVGAPVGFVCFAIVELLFHGLPDEAIKRAQRAAVKGSIFGITMGGGIVILASLFGIPDDMTMKHMFIPGVILGFIGGTLSGGINHARMEASDHEEMEVFPLPEPEGDDGESLLVDITRHLDQVHVRVTEIDREDGATRAGAAHRAFDDLDAETPKAVHHIIDGHGGDQAEIGGAGGGRSRFRIELSPDLMQVDLLITEGERLPLITERDDLHAEHTAVEIAGSADVADGEHEMVDAVDDHALSPGR